MKGITPIISTIVLLLITVALAGAAWVYIGGFMGTYTEKSFTIPTGGAYCDAQGSFHVRVVNTGTSTITSADWVEKSVTNSTITPLDLTVSSVPTKGTADFTVAGGDSGQSYMINIGTVAGVQHMPVVCP